MAPAGVGPTGPRAAGTGSRPAAYVGGGRASEATHRRRTAISTLTAIPLPRRHHGWALSDGSRLVNPQETAPNELRLNQWVSVDGRAYRITNMRQVAVTGRLVELAHHAPVYLSAGRTLMVFEVIPPPEEDEEDEPAAEHVPAPAAPARGRGRRAVPGAGRDAPGRRGR